MSKSPDRLTARLKLIELLEKDPRQTVKQLAEQFVNRTFLAGHLKALENQGYVRSKKTCLAKVYFQNSKKVS